MSVEIGEKILKFEAFINDVLKADLGQLETKLDQKNEQLSEFMQLKSFIKTLQDTGMADSGFKTKVDVGNNFFVQAHVENPREILLDVGLGYYVEFSLEDALVLLDVRIKLFQSAVENLRTEIARTNAHIKLILIGISELQGIE